MKNDKKFEPLFSVVSIDAWADGDGGWTWNESHRLFQFRSDAEDIKRMFLNRLRKFLHDGIPTVSGIRQHVDLGKGWYYVTDDWDVMEIRSRKDHCPWYACIRETPR